MYIRFSFDVYRFVVKHSAVDITSARRCVTKENAEVVQDMEVRAVHVARQVRRSIHSFRIFLYHLFKSTTTQKRSRHSVDTVPEFYAEVPQATASEGLTQDPYVAAKVGFEPATLRMKGVESTNEPPHPTDHRLLSLLRLNKLSSVPYTAVV